jgi:hypothetical protein
VDGELVMVGPSETKPALVAPVTVRLPVTGVAVDGTRADDQLRPAHAIGLATQSTFGLQQPTRTA